MIIESLVSQIEQSFLPDEAQVCFWFDEDEEFATLVPHLATHLTELRPRPFQLLIYSAQRRHGQSWISQAVTQAIRSRRAEPLRLLLYLPLSEALLEDAGGAGYFLGPLAEDGIEATAWRIDGQRPTLTGFLSQAGLNLVAADRRLDQDGLLAKYVAWFIGQPKEFWQAPLTAEIALSRLIGPIDQLILALAQDPEGVGRQIRAKGVEGEIQDMVAERYGPVLSLEDPAAWLREMVASLAITEAYLAYGEPSDFPLAHRLPPPRCRPHHLSLVHRWLKDSAYRHVWDRLIAEVEATIDLGDWARGKEGLSFAFPHLVSRRWQEAHDALERAAPRMSTVATVLGGYGDSFSREADYARASQRHPAGPWEALRALQGLVLACRTAMARIRKARSLASLSQLYIGFALSIEGNHREALRYAHDQAWPTVAQVADRVYGSYARALSRAMARLLPQDGPLAIPGVPGVTAAVEHAVWRAKGRRAVVIVDALTYEGALAMRERLRGHMVDVRPLLAVVPTITSMGMTSLLPLTGAKVSLEIPGQDLRPLVNGQDTSALEGRLAVLKAFGADCWDIQEVEAAREAPAKLSKLLVVLGRDEVDGLDRHEAGDLIRYRSGEIDRLAALVRKLHQWGYGRVHIVTDHGLVLHGHLPEQVPWEGAPSLILQERYVLVAATARVPQGLPLPWDPSLKVAFPPGLAGFLPQGAFANGGATLQELIIPHIISRGRAAQDRLIGVEVSLKEISSSAVTVRLRPVDEAQAQAQRPLFVTKGRTLSLDVVRRGWASVLEGSPRRVRLEPTDGEHTVTLAFRPGRGEPLELDIRDVETGERFVAGGVLTS